MMYSIGHLETCNIPVIRAEQVRKFPCFHDRLDVPDHWLFAHNLDENGKLKPASGKNCIR